MRQKLSKAVGTRTLGLDTTATLGLATALLFFLISGVIGYVNLERLRDNNQRIVHTHEVILSLARLLSVVQDAETGQRGFLLTNNERYLAPFDAASDIVVQRMDDTAALIGQDVSQQRRFAEVRAHVSAKFDELRQTIRLQKSQNSRAALAIVNSDRGKAQMDAIRSKLGEIEQEEARRRGSYLGEMQTAFSIALVSAVLTSLLGILLTSAIGVMIRRTTLARRREDWLRNGQVGFGDALAGDQRLEQLGGNLLDFLARYSGAVAGALYVDEGRALVRASTFGVANPADVPSRFESRQGLLGQAAEADRSLIIEDIPDGYITFGSALGTHKPRHLLIAPARVDGAVNAVVELGYLQPIEDAVVEFLDRLSPATAVAVRSANYRSELQNLLEETQRQAEELQAQGEELRVSNEELEEQGRALKESQVRLEQQQVELEQTNSQLEEQAQQLETQRDDLERVNASIELKARELEQASRYKSDFLANMSHELRTPLNSSLILAKLLADNPDDNLTPEQVKYAQTIQSSGNDLLNLINDILDLSKIEAGHVEIRPEPVSVERLASNLRQLFEPVANSKSISFKVVIDPECPQILETDLQRLEQVLKNLLSNAFKFTEKGEVNVAIKPAGVHNVSLAVSDTGIGVAEDQQRRIFEAFHQADGTISRKYGGTGLGLSISRELVRLLGGSLSLASQPGQGSTFTVTIPESYDASQVSSPERPQELPRVAIPDVPEIENLSSPSLRSRIEDDRGAPSGDQRMLLVIEDDDTFAMITRDLAREMGFRTLVAATAEEALDLAKRYLPNAIVLDIGLPDQSGLTVLDRLKRDMSTRHIPIHIISADDHSETALSLGAVGYLLKPVKREQLVDVLQKIEHRLDQRMHRVLIVEDNDVQREAVAKLLTKKDVETVSAATAADCLRLLREQTFDCMVLDLSLPDASGYSVLETISQDSEHSFPPVIVYTGRVLTQEEEQKLRRYSRSIIVKGAKSPERLLDEVTLFLHQVVSELPAEQQKMIRKALNRDSLLEGRRILVVEDDVRNVYALTNILEPRGAVIEIARNGKEALEKLEESHTKPGATIDLVLMDIMMPVMDGLTATREIRRNHEWSKLPIIALTAKAMPDDQQRCIDAGANDYMAKPLDVEKLLSLVRVWIPR